METYSSSVSSERPNYVFAVTASQSVLVVPAKAQRRSRSTSITAEGALASLALAIIALGIHGYHPYAEDGGPYFSAVLKAIHPGLYPSWTGFVFALTRFSVFAPLLSAMVRLSGLPLAWVNFMLYVASLWAAIFAGWLIAGSCFGARCARYGAVSILALSITLPIAGTSLLLMDPYLTARSISTPLGLFAIATMLQLVQSSGRGKALLWRSGFACALCVIASGLVHPLMTAYTAGLLVLLFVIARLRGAARNWSITGSRALAILLAGCVFRLSALATPEYIEAARSRSYWFLRSWHWYEIFGLIAPLVLLQVLTRFNWLHQRESLRWMALASIVAGATAIAVALLFARESSISYDLARLQPLRIFLPIYAVMILVLGAYAGEFLLTARRWQTAALFLCVGGGMFFVQQGTFPRSAHIEFPWNMPRNGWEQAFAWISENTPPDARIALDAQYINYPGEDAQYFSAIAERSALPDYSKDGGIAAIAPQLAREWDAAQKAQSGLNGETDAQRLAALQRFSIDWIVLPAASPTAFPCPFHNGAAKVCRIAR